MQGTLVRLFHRTDIAGRTWPRIAAVEQSTISDKAPLVPSAGQKRATTTMNNNHRWTSTINALRAPRPIRAAGRTQSAIIPSTGTLGSAKCGFARVNSAR
ncbi:uncharacterized protein LAESUDRAFT_725252 [Laetiporus sulphureus 93-53]|uniref:Uncharacterized protein n=1 Tax=Laetiporus sulphureus 93-53 TaxID=1314785 RepID=A0A165EM15_9APHY|nr:uncharacterized protein LAESUDRAFT_725252 [Laetiporus sulphureus 93-53]KZT07340.1 hypothetical protein LAESUDRAFT_725252 [Laetiporus sulphureus 93-53]